MFTTKRNNVLADGGMMQEGGTVDEVSGNNVPVGSTKEEVRDDIDAKLSVGEYVFPADVTRYFGIAKLEEMRKEAQEGLKQMESGGRMGNAEQVSEEAAAGYDDAQFSKEVDEDMVAYDKEQGYAEGGVVRKYKNGGAVTYDPVASKETYKRAPLKGFEMIPMSDDKGNTIYIPFINGKPQLNIPPGFAIRAAAPKVDEAAATDSTTPTAPAAEQRGGGSGDKTEQGGGGLGYSPTSGLTSPGPVSFQGSVQQGLEGYAGLLGGIMPYAGIANLAAKSMLPSATLAESAKEQSILAANKAAFGPSYAGAGYGTSVADGGFGVTSMTGAGIAANPMGIDPATAQGQQAMKDIVSESMQLSIDKNIDPNKALAARLAALQSEADQSAAESARLAAAENAAAAASQAAADAKAAQDARDAQAAADARALAEQSAAESARLAAREQAARDAENASRAAAEQASREQSAREAARAAEAQMARDAQARSDAAAAANNANYGNEGRNSGGGGGGGGAATGGRGGDASGGGDRGTRGGFAKGGLVSKRNN